jgi:Tfp pilus assembly protein PilN
MKSMGPNLAAQPFANERPVKRTTLLIWVLALVLLAINVFLYQRHLSAHNEQRQTIRSLQEKIGAEEEAIEQGEADLASLQISQQNDEVVFLNGQIASRTFSWSQLFDRLEEVLPANVELQRVSPKTLKERRGRRRQDQRLEDLVVIDMKGTAQATDELLALVDNLFDHSSFTMPNLMRENQRDDGQLEFDLNVLYLPSAMPEVSGETPVHAIEEAVLLDDSAGGDG